MQPKRRVADAAQYALNVSDDTNFKDVFSRSNCRPVAAAAAFVENISAPLRFVGA